MMEKIDVIIGVGIIAFTIVSHLLSAATKALVDLKKDQPGWLNTASTIVAKVLGFLNGVKPKAVEAAKV